MESCCVFVLPLFCGVNYTVFRGLAGGSGCGKVMEISPIIAGVQAAGF